jgi:hypothetical protein
MILSEACGRWSGRLLVQDNNRRQYKAKKQRVSAQGFFIFPAAALVMMKGCSYSNIEFIIEKGKEVRGYSLI